MGEEEAEKTARVGGGCQRFMLCREFACLCCFNYVCVFVMFVLAALCVCVCICVCLCVCESIMETRHEGNANKKEVPHKKLAHGQRRIGQRDGQANAAGYAYQI